MIKERKVKSDDRRAKKRRANNVHSLLVIIQLQNDFIKNN